MMPSLCNIKTCRKCATFNLPGNIHRTRCLEHKTPDMISVNKGNRPCQHSFCVREASYNFPSYATRIFCKTHALAGMVDVGMKRCSSIGCDISISNKQYRGKCMSCFVEANPDVRVFRNIKVKETEMTRFIKNTRLWPDAVYDKSILGGISMFRPDVFIDSRTHAVIVECDEHQHMKNRNPLKIHQRNLALQVDAKKPIVIIRFNPDRYVALSGIAVKSCFCTDDEGRVVVRNESVSDWNRRLQKLQEEIIHQLAQRNVSETITVVLLFFSS